MWNGFAKNVGLVRHQVGSEAGREMRDRRYAGSRAWFRSAAERRGIDAATPEGKRFVSLALLLTSSLSFLELHDRQGLHPDDAVDAVSWGVEVLTRATRNELRRRSR